MVPYFFNLHLEFLTKSLFSDQENLSAYGEDHACAPKRFSAQARLRAETLHFGVQARLDHSLISLCDLCVSAVNLDLK